MLNSSTTVSRRVENSLLTIIQPSSLMMGIGSVLIGSAAAALSGNAEFIPATLCILFVVFTQAGANVLHCYYKRFGNKRVSISGQDIDINIENFSDGKVIIGIAQILLVLSGMIGLTIMSMYGWWMIIPGLLVAFFGGLSVLGRNVWNKVTWNLISTFMLFGPICVIGTCLVQSAHEAEGEILNWFDLGSSVILSIVSGLMAMDCYLIYGYYNYRSDRQSSRKNLTTVFGRHFTRNLVVPDGVAELLLCVLFAFMFPFGESVWMWSVALLFPLMALLISIFIRTRMSESSLDTGGRIHLLVDFRMLLVGLGLLVCFIIMGREDDSVTVFF